MSLRTFSFIRLKTINKNCKSDQKKFTHISFQSVRNFRALISLRNSDSVSQSNVRQTNFLSKNLCCFNFLDNRELVCQRGSSEICATGVGRRANRAGRSEEH